MDQKTKTDFKVVNHRKNGEIFNPRGFVLPYEITKSLIDTVSLSAFVFRSSGIKEEVANNG